MKPHEVTQLCGYIAAVKPSHKLDEVAAKAWAHVLARVSVEDARVVVDGLLATQQWIEPNDIVQAARRLRRDRLERAGFTELTPNVEPLVEVDGRLVENPAHRDEKLALRDAIASGAMSQSEVTAYARGEVPTLTGAPAAITAGALVSRQMPELRGVTRRPEPG